MFFAGFRNIHQTLAFRLTLWYAGIFVLSILAAFFVLYIVLTSTAQRNMDQELSNEITEFASLMRSGGMEAVRRNIAVESQSSGKEHLYFVLMTPEGRAVMSSDLSAWHELTIDPAALRLASSSRSLAYSTVNFPGHDHSTRVIYGRIGDNAILQIGMSLEEQEIFHSVVRTTLAITLSVLIAAAILIGWFLSRRAIQGVEEVTDTATAIAAGALDRRVEVTARYSEIERLATAFNAMLERIHSLIAGMRDVTDNIAHDLRSPITRIRGIAEVTLTSHSSVRDFISMAVNTIEECDRLLEMINTMLDITETESGAAELHRENLDLSRLALDASELFEPLAEDRGIIVTTDMGPHTVVTGDRQRLQRMVANLLDNAIKYTPSGGKVSVSVHSSAETAVLTISDNGIGIAEQDLPRIFDRFYRCDRSRSRAGNGLGLSLARAIAEAHGGFITAASSPGRGSTFTVTLPRQQFLS